MVKNKKHVQSRRSIEHWSIPHARHVCQLETKLLHLCNTISIVKLSYYGNRQRVAQNATVEVYKQQINKMSTEKSGEKKSFLHTQQNRRPKKMSTANVEKKSNPGVPVAQKANPQFG